MLVFKYYVLVYYCLLYIIILFRIGPGKLKSGFITLSPKTYLSPLPTRHLTLYSQAQTKAQQTQA